MRAGSAPAGLAGGRDHRAVAGLTAPARGRDDMAGLRPARSRRNGCYGCSPGRTPCASWWTRRGRERCWPGTPASARTPASSRQTPTAGCDGWSSPPPYALSIGRGARRLTAWSITLSRRKMSLPGRVFSKPSRAVAPDQPRAPTDCRHRPPRRPAARYRCAAARRISPRTAGRKDRAIAVTGASPATYGL
jgi:hypothetical protein